MKTIDKSSKKSYAELYPNIVDILENDRWIYDDLVAIQNEDIILKQFKRILKLKNASILRAIQKLYKEHRDETFSKLYNSGYSPRDFYKGVIDMKKFYDFHINFGQISERIDDDSDVGMILPNIYDLEQLNFKDKKLIKQRDYFVNLFDKVSLSLGLISSIILELEFISQFLTNDEDISYFIAGDGHVTNIRKFLRYLKEDKTSLIDIKLRYKKILKREKLSNVKCRYMNLHLNKIV